MHFLSLSFSSDAFLICCEKEFLVFFCSLNHLCFFFSFDFRFVFNYSYTFLCLLFFVCLFSCDLLKLPTAFLLFCKLLLFYVFVSVQLSFYCYCLCLYALFVGFSYSF